MATAVQPHLIRKVFFADQLHKIYRAESNPVKPLSELQASADIPLQSKKTLCIYHEQTKHGIITPEQQVFGITGTEANFTQCRSVADIADELQGHIELVFAAPQAKPYKTPFFSNVIVLANALSYNNAAPLLKQNLAWQRKADALFTRIAEKISSNSAAFSFSKKNHFIN